MQNTVIDIKGHWTSKRTVNETFSFSAFVRYIKQYIESEKTIKAEFYRFVLNKFSKDPNLLTGDIDIAAIGNYGEFLELVYTLLSPATGEDNKFYWALSSPIPTQIFYSTNVFFDFLKDHNSGSLKNGSERSALFHQSKLDYTYRLMLQKLYNFPTDLNKDIIYSLPSGKGKLVKYYKVQINSSFVEVKCDIPLPPLNPEIIEPCIYEGAGMEILKDILPLEMFRFKGFSVITIQDITAEHAVKTIRTALVNNDESQATLYKKVIGALKILSKHASISFGLLPFIRVNGELIFDPAISAHSYIVKTAKRYRSSAVLITSFIQKYTEAPKAMFFSTISPGKAEQYPFLEVLQRTGIKSYALLPVWYNRDLIGMIEIYSDQKVIFYEKLLSRLQPAVPLISQLLKDSADTLNGKMETVIKNKFTMLQPAVEWKFNEAAWDFIRTNKHKVNADIGTVTFKKVYPLYGSIDMRNSTREHNAAFVKDMEIFERLLTDTVNSLKSILPKKEVTQLSSCFKKWQKGFISFKKTYDEAFMKSFLYENINPYLLRLTTEHPVSKAVIDTYLKEANEKTGKAYSHRNDVEMTMKKINSLLSHYFEKQVAKLQKIYPCYFEKFRSDGIEYDVYTGADMTKDIAFKPTHLKRFRQWQLSSMIEVGNLTHTLLPKLPVPIETASLIFVHTGHIDICFRNDERRFDVEGYYNIRYEVIKKRIDKALIKNTGERLTQPGKISLVYFDEDEINAYVEHIKKLQRTGVLKNDLENVTLAELQGVTNIKAMRVSINYNHKK